jgi:hypothetical protein
MAQKGAYWSVPVTRKGVTEGSKYSTIQEFTSRNHHKCSSVSIPNPKLNFNAVPPELN